MELWKANEGARLWVIAAPLRRGFPALSKKKPSRRQHAVYDVGNVACPLSAFDFSLHTISDAQKQASTRRDPVPIASIHVLPVPYQCLSGMHTHMHMHNMYMYMSGGGLDGGGGETLAAFAAAACRSGGDQGAVSTCACSDPLGSSRRTHHARGGSRHTQTAAGRATAARGPGRRSTRPS